MGRPAPTTVAAPDVERSAQLSQLATARRVARGFFGMYVSFLYGRVSAAQVPYVDREVRRQLAQGHTLGTPAEQAARPRIERVTVTAAGPPVSAIAVATLSGVSGSIQLTATLEPRGGRWLIVALDP